MPRQRKHGRLAPILAGARPTVPAKIKDIPESRRRAIYAALSQAMATGREPDAARFAVAKEFVLTIMRVEAVEREGLVRGWPSLDEQ